jgi:hypothetical protein
MLLQVLSPLLCLSTGGQVRRPRIKQTPEPTLLKQLKFIRRHKKIEKKVQSSGLGNAKNINTNINITIAIFLWKLSSLII